MRRRVRGEGKTRSLATAWAGRGGEHAPDSTPELPSPGGSLRPSPARANRHLLRGYGRGLTGREMEGTGCCECACGTRWGGKGQGGGGTPAARTPMRSDRRKDLRSNSTKPALQAQCSSAGRGMRACEHAARAERTHLAAPPMPTQAYPRPTSLAGARGEGGRAHLAPGRAAQSHSDVISCQ